MKAYFNLILAVMLIVCLFDMPYGYYTLPRLRKERQSGNLLKEVPMIKILWAPISWTAIILFGLYYAHLHYAEHITQIYLGLGIAAFGLIKRIGGQNADMKDDFRRTYKEYLRE